MNTLTSAVILRVMCKINIVSARYHYIHRDKFSMPCDSTQQCEELGFKNYTCINQSCLCEKEKECESPKLNAIVTNVGQPCLHSFDCNIEQAVCNQEGKCACTENTVSSNNKRKCLNVSKSLGSSCYEDIQCASLNAVCINKLCSCESSYMHHSEGKCFKSVALGYPCQRDEECSITDFSSCKSNKCLCNKEYVQSESHFKCLLKALTVLSVCSEDIQCTSVLGFGSKCLNGFCMCTELHHHRADINKCVIDVLLGQPCEKHSDCHQPGGGESRLECIIGECKCKPAYFQDAGFCILSSAKNWKSVNICDILPYILSYLFCYVLV